MSRMFLVALLEYTAYQGYFTKTATTITILFIDNSNGWGILKEFA